MPYRSSATVLPAEQMLYDSLYRNPPTPSRRRANQILKADMMVRGMGWFYRYVIVFVIFGVFCRRRCPRNKTQQAAT